MSKKQKKFRIFNKNFYNEKFYEIVEDASEEEIKHKISDNLYNYTYRTMHDIPFNDLASSILKEQPNSKPKTRKKKKN